MRIILTNTKTNQKRFIEDVHSFSSYVEYISDYEPSIHAYVVKNKHGKELCRFDGDEYTFEIKNTAHNESQLTHH